MCCIQGLEEDDHLHRIEMKGMVETKSKLPSILVVHLSPRKILRTILKGSNYDPCTDEQIEA